jgi:hypothetical protein
LRRRFTSLLREETAKETYLIFKALAYESSTSKSCEYYKESLTLSFDLVLVILIVVLSFLVTLICSVTALTSEFSRNARRLVAYRSACLTFSTTSEYRHIRPTFATTLILVILTVILSFPATLILNLTFFCLALSLGLILISSSFCSALSSGLILILSSLCSASSLGLILILSSFCSALSLGSIPILSSFCSAPSSALSLLTISLIRRRR